MRAYWLVACATAYIAAFLFTPPEASAQQRVVSPGSYYSALDYRLREIERKVNEAAENAKQQGNVAVGSSAAILEFRLRELEKKASEAAENLRQQGNASAGNSVAILDHRIGEIDRKLNEDANILKTQSNEFLEYKTLFKTLALVVGVVGSVLALLFGWWQTRRASTHREILKRGEETISLVNNILALAKESTQSAMKATESRARKELAVLDQAVNKLMLFANRDARDVVLRREKNDQLKDLFHELTAFEYANRNLDEPLHLTPACMFLKALKYSEEHRFEAAIEKWRSTYMIPDASPGIKLRSRYWIGYEQNNLGRFAEAEESFDAAVGYANTKVANASDERRIELERLGIETKLYRMAGQEAKGLITKIEALVQECERKYFNEAKMAALRTKGNILYTISLSEFNSGKVSEAGDFMRQAKELWKDLAEGEQDVNIAARREYVFACYALQENLEGAEELLKQKVREEARRQYTNCIGHKEKAYYAMVQFMVAVAQKASGRAQSMDTRANFHVAETHDLEYPFSPLRKRPVSRQDFHDDIRWVNDNGLPVVV
jgi:hypothetical protein